VVRSAFPLESCVNQSKIHGERTTIVNILLLPMMEYVPVTKKNGNAWEDSGDSEPLWLLQPHEWKLLPPDTMVESINREKKRIKELTEADADTRFGATAWGLRESQLAKPTPAPLAPTPPFPADENKKHVNDCREKT
jgi:hypothetical protein